MATFQELMRAADRADRAGDEEGARTLVRAARKMMPKSDTPQDGLYRDGDSGLVLPTVGDNLAPAPQADTFGDTVSKVTEPARNMMSGFAAGVMDETQSPTHQALPDWLPERAKHAASLAGDLGGTALGALGTAYSTAAGTVGEVLGGTPTQERKLASDLMAMGEIAVPQLAGASGTVAASGKAARAAKNLAPKTPMQEAARAADDLGITPSLGAGGKTRAQAAGILESTPISSGRIVADSQRFVGEVEDQFNRTIAKVGTVRDSADAGAQLQKGLQKFVSDFKDKSEELYARVGQFLPENATVQADATVATIRDAAAAFQGKDALLRELGLSKWDRIAEDLQGGISWQGVKDLRTSVGRAIARSDSVLGDTDTAQLKRLYASLTNDMERAVAAAGPEATAAWKRANNYYKRGADRIEGDLDKFVSADSPERAIEAFVSSTKMDRATSNEKRLFRIKASVPQGEWGDVAASVIDRLGRARAGGQNADGDAFSMATFLTEWNKMSKGAKSALLPQEARKEMDQLAKVAEVGKGAEREINHSRSGTVMTSAIAGSGLATAPVTTTAILGSTYLGTRALTNPVFLRALNRSARGDQRALRRIANSDNEFAADAQTILRMSGAQAAQPDDPANVNRQLMQEAR